VAATPRFSIVPARREPRPARRRSPALHRSGLVVHQLATGEHTQGPTFLFTRPKSACPAVERHELKRLMFVLHAVCNLVPQSSLHCLLVSPRPSRRSSPGRPASWSRGAKNPFREDTSAWICNSKMICNRWNWLPL
jgi:hypothetical protein